jgi:hypothetical protein
MSAQSRSPISQAGATWRRSQAVPPRGQVPTQRGQERRTSGASSHLCGCPVWRRIISEMKAASSREQSDPEFRRNQSDRGPDKTSTARTVGTGWRGGAASAGWLGGTESAQGRTDIDGFPGGAIDQLRDAEATRIVGAAARRGARFSTVDDCRLPAQHRGSRTHRAKAAEIRAGLGTGQGRWADWTGRTVGAARTLFLPTFLLGGAPRRHWRAQRAHGGQRHAAERGAQSNSSGRRPAQGTCQRIAAGRVHEAPPRATADQRCDMPLL